ncbi:hypothetical protein EDC04DRAFT_2916895 [Pisolithus marmoratus]|nr:hypothetical protein EDC04DRAFT_2916895 [Pisolithus marmoratus]
MASAPTTFTPVASILDTSPLLHPSSGSHSDPGAPTVPQGAEGISRDWSSVAATKPLSAIKATQKLDWGDVLMTAELTSQNASLELTLQIKCKVLAMFNAQPNRAFSYSLTFCNGQCCLYMYDHAGSVHSHWYNLHESPIMLLHILCAAAFAPTSWLGIDDMFNCQLHPVITIGDMQYFIISNVSPAVLFRVMPLMSGLSPPQFPQVI